MNLFTSEILRAEASARAAELEDSRTAIINFDSALKLNLKSESAVQQHNTHALFSNTATEPQTVVDTPLSSSTLA